MKFRFRNAMPTPGIRASVLVPEVLDGIATLRLFDPVDSWGGDWGVSAKEFAAALGALPDDTHTINLHINSPGGEVFEAVTILNQLRQHQARIVAIVDGLAASAASYIAVGADEVQMAPNTQLMIHDAWGLAIGNAADMRSAGDLLDRLSNNIASIYAAKAGGTVEDWRAAMLAESWYSAEEAVAAGLADSILGTDTPEEDAAKALANVDTSDWKYSSRDEAPAPLIAARGGFPGRIRQRTQANGVKHRLS